MNCVQQIMISGSHRMGWLEWVADCCLTPAAVLWRGKNVRLINDDNELTALYSSHSWFSNETHSGGGGAGGCGAVILLSVGYSLVSVVASPFLFVGGALKLCAFQIDPEAEDYNQMACNHLNELDDMSQIDKELREGCCYNPHGDTYEQKQKEITNTYNRITHLKTKLNERVLLNTIQQDINAGESICKHGENQFSYFPILKGDVIIDHEIVTSPSSKMKLSTSLNKWHELLTSYENELQGLQTTLQTIEADIAKYRSLTPTFLVNVSQRETDSFI